MSSGYFGVERRRVTRHSCSDRLVRAVVFLGTEACPGPIQDLSLGGLCMVLKAIVAPGEWLNIELRNSTDAVSLCKTARVVHATPTQPKQLDLWSVGCEFAEPLARDQLRKLLGVAATVSVGS